MPAAEETGSGPVIHDNRRIDPVTGQVRGKHAASKAAGTTSAGRPAEVQGPQGPQGSQGSSGSSGPAGATGAAGPDSSTSGKDSKDSEDDVKATEADEEILEGILEEPTAADKPEI